MFGVFTEARRSYLQPQRPETLSASYVFGIDSETRYQVPLFAADRSSLRSLLTFSPLRVAALCLAWAVAVASLHAAQDQVTPPTSLTNALPAEPTGEQIFRQACATCHALDGAGSPQSVVGFALPLANGHDFPDFNDCPTNTVRS